MEVINIINNLSACCWIFTYWDNISLNSYVKLNLFYAVILIPYVDILLSTPRLHYVAFVFEIKLATNPWRWWHSTECHGTVHPWVQQLSQDVQADAACVIKAAAFRDMIKGSSCIIWLIIKEAGLWRKLCTFLKYVQY